MLKLCRSATTSDYTGIDAAGASTCCVAGQRVLDFGLGVEIGQFEFQDTYCIAPTSLVLAYALAVATSGNAAQILMAGFDGYQPGDPRNDEVDHMLSIFATSGISLKLISITSTRYKNLPG